MCAKSQFDMTVLLQVYVCYSVYTEGSHEEQYWCKSMNEYNPWLFTSSYVLQSMR